MKRFFKSGESIHSMWEDAVAWAVGCLFVAFGMVFLKGGNISTGGTAGLSILASYLTDIPLGQLFFLINLPFFLWSWRDLGWSFTVRSAFSVGLISALASGQGEIVSVSFSQPIYAALAGGLSAGVGFLILFRHGFSVGGLSLVAFSLSRRLGISVARCMLAMDAMVLLACAATIGVDKALASAVGIVVLNTIVQMNHRPSRYIGTSHLPGRTAAE